MRLALEPYRRLHLSYDELCVAGAFLELPCLYGVSDRWLKRSTEPLYGKVMRVTDGLERKGLLIPQLSGEILMDQQLYRLVSCMGHAKRLGRLSYSREGRTERVYLYQKDRELVFLEEDGRGGCHLGTLPTVRQLQEALMDIPRQQKADEGADDFFGVTAEQWLGALLFERRGSFYDPLMDLAWRETCRKPDDEKDLAACWQQLCRCLEVTEI